MENNTNDCVSALPLYSLGVLLLFASMGAGAVHAAGTGATVPDFSGSYIHRHAKASRGGDGKNLNEPKLTAEAIALVEAYDPADDFVIQCEPTDLKRQILHPYPMEITQTDSTLTFRYEGWEAERTIHINGEFPHNIETTKLGYSIGHFEGNDLVIETRGMQWGFIDEIDGWKYSEDAHFTERYTRYADPEDNHIELLLTIDDPRRFEEPVLIADAWTWDPSAVLLEYKCLIPESHGLGR